MQALQNESIHAMQTARLLNAIQMRDSSVNMKLYSRSSTIIALLPNADSFDSNLTGYTLTITEHSGISQWVARFTRKCNRHASQATLILKNRRINKVYRLWHSFMKRTSTTNATVMNMT